MIDPDLWALLPPFRRARGDRLYDAGQKHWVDLWKQDGAWLLGHRPEGAATEWKIQLDKGLSAWLPSAWPARLEKLVPRLVAGAETVRLYRNPDRAPAAALWRPWDDQPLVPGPWRLVLPSGPAQAVAVAAPAGVPLPPSDVVAPVEAAALVTAAGQLLRFGADPRAEVARRRARADFDRFVAPGGRFVRQGLWFRPAPGEVHADLFRSHWEGGFLLNPDPEGWNVVPTELSRGEWAAWSRLAGGSS